MKIVKHILWGILIALSCIILLFGIGLLLLRSPRVQTAIINQITADLTDSLQVDAHFGKIAYRPLNRLEINDIYLSDLHGDTLFYTQSIQAHFRLKEVFHKRIVVHSVDIERPTIYLKKDTVGILNCAFLESLFSNDDTTFTLWADLLSVKNVQICHATFKYVDLTASSIPARGFNKANILITDFNAELTLPKLTSDSLDAQIVSLSFNEQSGFRLDDLSAHLIADSHKINLQTLAIKLPKSEVSTQVCQLMLPNSRATKIDDIETNLVLAKTELTFQDIAAFMPLLNHVNSTITLQGQVTGKIRALQAQNLLLTYNKLPVLQGSIKTFGLPNIETAQVEANLQDLLINHSWLQDLISDLQGNPFHLPKEVARLGNAHYHGVLAGRLDSLVLNGAFSTRLGTITTDGTLIARDTFHTVTFNGQIQTKRFDLKRLLADDNFGDVALCLTIDGGKTREEGLTAELQGTVSSFDYKKYEYSNIYLDVSYAPNVLAGQLRIEDENLNLDISGLADLNEEMPVLKGDIFLLSCRLGELHLSEKYTHSNLSFYAGIDAIGNTLDNLTCAAFIRDFTFENKDTALLMKQFELTMDHQQRNTRFNITSDYLNAHLEGPFKYNTLLASLKKQFMQYMPCAFSVAERNWLATVQTNNEASLHIDINRFDDIARVLELPYSAQNEPYIDLTTNDATKKFILDANIPDFIVNGTDLDSIKIACDNLGNEMELNLSVFQHANKKASGRQMGDVQFNLLTQARNDSVFLDLNWDNRNDSNHVDNSGQLRLTTSITHYSGKPLVSVHVLPSRVIFADSIWTMHESLITYDAADTALSVDNFHFESATQYVWANGVASTRNDDSIHVALRDINLNYVLGYTNVLQAVSFEGEITGWANIRSLFREPKFEANAFMENAGINNTRLGDLTASAHWNKEEERIDILGLAIDNERSVVGVIGLYKPLEARWDLQIKMDSVDVAIVNRWTNAFLDNVQGRAYGDLHIFGKGQKTYVELSALTKNAEVGLGFLGTRYRFTDSITMDTAHIYMRDIHLTDEEGHPILLNGLVTHDGQFKSMDYDVRVNCQNALALNWPFESNAMMYGKVYASGLVHVQGDDYSCKVNANARTDANTKFGLSLATASLAQENTFIKFIDHNAKKDKKGEIRPMGSHINLTLQVDVTPQADIEMLIDPAQGEQINGKGAGNIRVEYDDYTGDVALYGGYTLESGTFYFSLQNILRKEFKIGAGSSLTWAGDPVEPVVDLNASYRANAALKDLMGSDYEQLASTNRPSVPVDCRLFLKGSLWQPTINFDITLPNSDEAIRQQVRSIINTDEMMMCQVLYLLVFNKFYTPEYLQTTRGTEGVYETYALLSSTVTGQINNWLSKLTNNFTVGFNIRASGDETTTNNEYETQFQYQPNNRLLINGDIGYRNDQTSNMPIFGDVDVEYLLDPAGHFRAKAYTHSVDKYSFKEAKTVQGVGIVYKTDFNFSDLVKKKKDKK